MGSDIQESLPDILQVSTHWDLGGRLVGSDIQESLPDILQVCTLWDLGGRLVGSDIHESIPDILQVSTHWDLGGRLVGSDIQESLPDILEYRETGKLLTPILLLACKTGMQAVETVYKHAVVLINHERLEQVEHSLTELCHGEVRDTRDACLIMENDSG